MARTLRSLSPIFFFVAASACVPEPRLVDVRVDKTRHEGADFIRVEIVGEDIAGYDVESELFAVSHDTGEDQMLAYDRSTFAPEYSAGFGDDVVVWEYRIDKDALEAQGMVEFYAVARFQGEVLASKNRISLATQPTISQVTLRYSIGQLQRVLGSGNMIPPNQELTLQFQSTNLIGETLTLSAFSDGALADERTFEVTANSMLVSYTLDPNLTGRAGPVFLEVSYGALRRATPEVEIASRGIHYCGWTDTSGEILPNDMTIMEGRTVFAKAWTWGMEGSLASVQIFEDDAFEDQLIDDIATTVVGNTIDFEWLTRYRYDGALQDTNEYFYELSIGNTSCASTFLNVRAR